MSIILNHFRNVHGQMCTRVVRSYDHESLFLESVCDANLRHVDLPPFDRHIAL